MAVPVARPPSAAGRRCRATASTERARRCDRASATCREQTGCHVRVGVEHGDVPATRSPSPAAATTTRDDPVANLPREPLRRLLSGAWSPPRGARVGVVLSGGNVDALPGRPPSASPCRRWPRRRWRTPRGGGERHKSCGPSTTPRIGRSSKRFRRDELARGGFATRVDPREPMQVLVRTVRHARRPAVAARLPA